MTRKTPSKKNHRAAQHRRKRLLQLASASAPAAASCEFRSLLAACSALVGDIANWTQWLITLLAATLVDGFWFACEVLMQPPSQVLGFLYQVVSELIFVVVIAVQWLRNANDPVAREANEELQARVRELELELKQIRKLQRKQTDQLARWLARAPMSDAVASKAQSKGSLASVAAAAPPPPPPAPMTAPPPPPPPPMMMPKRPALPLSMPLVTAKKRADRVAAAAAGTAISLDVLLRARKGLRRASPESSKENVASPDAAAVAAAYNPLASLAVSLQDLSNVRLRQSAAKSEKKSRVKSPAMSFTLRRTAVDRSPGGTPMRGKTDEDTNGSTTNLLTSALRNKFKHAKLPSPKSSPDARGQQSGSNGNLTSPFKPRSPIAMMR